MTTCMNYGLAKDWIIEENIFNPDFLGKCEAIMSLGNGYLGLRSATEERYLGERRGYFAAGTFNKFNESEVTELPNMADIVHLELLLNGQYFTLEKGEIKKYSRQLHLKTGELQRHIQWISPAGDEIHLDFYRVVSLQNLHLTAQKIVITPVDADMTVKIISGIDGRMTNSGSQHFSDGDKRFYDKKYMQLIQTTGESGIDVVHNTTLSFTADETPVKMDSRIVMDRRKIYCEYQGGLKRNQTLIIEKISNVYTSRDIENEGISLTEIQDKSLAALKISAQAGYDRIACDSASEWRRKVWEKNEILVEAETEETEKAEKAEKAGKGEDVDYDQLAVRFVQYHLCVMTPAHDHRMSIAAKGLSGEGYKGHTFWDTDIFVLPYFTFTNPKIARGLEEYRCLSLAGAHKKAAANGFRGAQFPWESAWFDDGEVTPVWGAADIVTGLPTKIWSGFIEQHITADVAFGIWQYYLVTGDQDFMDTYGYELFMDTAIFWASRLEYGEEDGLYHINDVVGPDEYKEHADDNAFTNYMAYWNIRKAIEYYHLLEREKPELLAVLSRKLDLPEAFPVWRERVGRIYLPQPRETDSVIPQDKAYLTLPDIDLTKYKNQSQVGSMFLDYNLEQVNRLQVSKQADIMILFLLMEDMFSLEVKRANWNYYEPRTLHDSSLSLSTHCILANDMGNDELAYQLFNRAARIDLGPNMNSSDDGIHAASIGGIWQAVVFGFGGVRMLNGTLRIQPRLPRKWKKLRFSICWHGQTLRITITAKELKVENMTKTGSAEFCIFGNQYIVTDEIKVKL